MARRFSRALDAPPTQTRLPEELPEDLKARHKHEIRVECNMEEFPYFRLSKKDAKRFNKIYFAREVRSDLGGAIKQRWIVVADSELGLPGPFDQDVYVAMEAIIDEIGIHAEGYVPFTCYRIAQLLGKNHSGRTYINIRAALTRMVATRITSEKAFYLKGEKTHISETFHLYDSVHFEERSNPKRSRAAFEYNLLFPCRWYIASRQQNYTKPLDLVLYRQLESPTAKKLYRYLDKRRYSNPSHIELDLFRLTDALPLTPGFPSKIKQVLAEPHRQLQNIDFLKNVQFFQSPKSRLWRILYTFPEKTVEAKRGLIHGPLAKMLTSRGISHNVAEMLAQTYPDRVSGQIEAFDWLRANKSRLVQQNPPGYLRKAIEENYVLPGAFLTEKERKAVTERGIADNRRLKDQEDKKADFQRRLKAEIEQVKASLGQDELQGLRKEAEDNLAHFFKALFHRDRKELGHLGDTSQAALEYELDRVIERRYLNPSRSAT